MKKLIIVALLASSSVFAAEDVFKKGEWSLESLYTARFSGSFDAPQQTFGAGVSYAITKNIVAGVRGMSYIDTPQLVNEVIGRVTYRVPLSFIAPYAFTEGGGNLQTGEGFAGAGGGIEARLIKHVSAFVESDLRLNTEWKSSIGVGGGVRISF